MAAVEELQLDGQLLGGLSPARCVELVRVDEEFTQQVRTLPPAVAIDLSRRPRAGSPSPVGDETDARTAFHNSVGTEPPRE
ncbi:hypothetical protein ACH4MN_16215 [Streptomyces anulatus]|uniref:hypothetical protein n=1 Tax=Streptomyces TaxID=1883 RepID=UPI001B360A84|nr:hypothetical protein [Streptomyces sp. C3-3]MBQ1115597.1 hypothetical protein [Streptomyces sp. C3-3]